MWSHPHFEKVSGENLWMISVWKAAFFSGA
jgi:hypothetical protein